MTSGVGNRLLAFLRELQATTTWAVVDSRRWLGLEFEARDPVSDRRATYDIDTDLYDIAQDRQREFAEEIERDIVEFLDNLRKGLVLRGDHRSKLVLVFPLNGSYVRVVQGRFMAGASTHADLASARTGGDYVPVE